LWNVGWLVESGCFAAISALVASSPAVAVSQIKPVVLAQMESRIFTNTESICLPVFLTVVCVVRNQANRLEELAREVAQGIGPLVRDYDLVFIDNGSDDHSVAELKRITDAGGIENVQVYALAKEVDSDVAALVGLENALGDFAVVLDPISDSIPFLHQMLSQAVMGADVVFARNTARSPQTLTYSMASFLFNCMYKWFAGVHLINEAPKYRMLSRKVVNFILQHPRASLVYRQLPATAGFVKVNLTYSKVSSYLPRKRLCASLDRGVQMLVSSTRAPMRLVTGMSLFGAYANVLYSLYVVCIALFKEDVAPGWVSMSLQQSGMFFLISLVLLVLGEYLLSVVSLSGEGPGFRVAQEFKSSRMSRQEHLNVSAMSVPSKDDVESHDASSALL